MLLPRQQHENQVQDGLRIKIYVFKATEKLLQTRREQKSDETMKGKWVWGAEISTTFFKTLKVIFT